MNKPLTTLEEVRAEKLKCRSNIGKDLHKLRGDITDCFMPTKSLFVNSTNKYLSWIGYGITAYKTFTTMRGFASFLRKLV